MSEVKQTIVIGAGILGAAIGYRLAKAGAPPLILDAGDGEGGLATSASWAWLNASWGNSPSYAAFRRQALASWRRLAMELPELPLRFCGSLTYDLPPTDLAAFASQHAAADYPIRIVGADEIRVREPNLREVPDKAALCGGEGVAEPALSARLLRQQALSLGARLQPRTRVTGLIHKGGRVAGVATDAGPIAADIVVCAAGIGTPELLASAGFNLPMKTPEGLLAHSEPLPPVLNGLIIAPKLDLRQSSQGRLIASVDFSGTLIGTRDETAAHLLQRMNAVLRLPEPARLAFTTIGQRPIPGDDMPAIGHVPGTDGLYVATMHSGMTLAALVSELAAVEILGPNDASQALLAPYRPARFTNSSAN